MPKKAGFVRAQEYRHAPDAVGMKLLLKYDDLDRQKITDAVRGLTVQYGQLQKFVIQGGQKRHSDLQKRFREPIELLARVRVILCWKEEEAIIKGVLSQNEMLAEREKLSPEFIKKHLPPDSDQQRGRELMDCLDRSGGWIEQFREDQDPVRAALVQHVKVCRDEIMDELSRHDILKICPECANTFYPTTETKMHCTPDMEARNCGGNLLRRESYHRRKKIPRSSS